MSIAISAEQTAGGDALDLAAALDEAVRQIRRTSVNQVPGSGPALVTAGTGVPTSAPLLAEDTGG